MKKNTKTKKPLVSSRYDAMYIPNTSWDFFDAFTQSPQCTAAFEQGETSIQGKNLKKYLVVAEKERLRLYREQKAAANAISPPRFISELLLLQSSSGKFESLPAVLSCLFLPKDITFARDKMYTDWEKATAFAVAALRQQNQYFDLLCESHDLAYQWLTSNELVYEARELISTYQGTKTEVPKESESIKSVSEVEKRDNIAMISDGIDSSDLTNCIDKQQNTNSTFRESFLELHTIDEFNENESLPGSTVEEPPINGGKCDDISIVNIVKPPSEVVAPKMNYPSSDVKVKNSGLVIETDPNKIAHQRSIVDKLQLKVIELSITIEKKVNEIGLCLDRCVAGYDASETRQIRQQQFDELTCLLGEGRQPMLGFKDWRLHGAVGLRPYMISFFSTVQLLANARLYLQELEQPQDERQQRRRGIVVLPSEEAKATKTVPTVVNIVNNLNRWKLTWNGYDVVLKTVHCLDFLRQSRELSEWYGPGFYFVANPLMLPVPMYTAYQTLDMERRVCEEQQSVPHCRLVTAATGVIDSNNNNSGDEVMQTNWQTDRYFNQWRRSFQKLCTEWSFNWPTVPDIRNDLQNQQVHDSIMVIYITCLESVKQSYTWERSFISKINTVRGQDKHLIGQNTLKLDKPLDIPELSLRKHRDGVYNTTTTTTAVAASTAAVVNDGIKNNRTSMIAPPPSKVTKNINNNNNNNFKKAKKYIHFGLHSDSSTATNESMSTALEAASSLLSPHPSMLLDGKDSLDTATTASDVLSPLPTQLPLRPNLARAAAFTRMVKTAESDVRKKFTQQQQLSQQQQQVQSTISLSGSNNNAVSRRSVSNRLRSPGLIAPISSVSRKAGIAEHTKTNLTSDNISNKESNGNDKGTSDSGGGGSSSGALNLLSKRRLSIARQAAAKLINNNSNSSSNNTNNAPTTVASEPHLRKSVSFNIVKVPSGRLLVEDESGMDSNNNCNASAESVSPPLSPDEDKVSKRYDKGDNDDSDNDDEDGGDDNSEDNDEKQKDDDSNNEEQRAKPASANIRQKLKKLKKKKKKKLHVDSSSGRKKSISDSTASNAEINNDKLGDSDNDETADTVLSSNPATNKSEVKHVTQRKKRGNTNVVLTTTAGNTNGNTAAVTTMLSTVVSRLPPILNDTKLTHRKE